MKKHFSDIEIGAYMEGRLTPEKKEKMEKHFIADKKSWNEFISIGRVIARKDESSDVPVPEYLTGKVLNMYPQRPKVFDIVIGLIKDAIKVIDTALDIKMAIPLSAQIRSSKVLSPRMAVFSKAFETISAEFNIEKVTGNLCNIKVIITDNHTQELMNNLRVDLISNGRELASDRPENGKVLFEDVGPGRYAVRMHRNSEIFGELAIKIE